MSRAQACIRPGSDPLNLEELSSIAVEKLRDFLQDWQRDPRAMTASPAPDRVALLETLLGAAVCRRLGIYRLPEGFLLSVVIPVFNESGTIEEVIRRVRAGGVPC